MYRGYVQTYIERDVRLLVNIKDLDQFQRFLRLCTTRIGQLIDYTQLANELGISRHTIKEWISILKASFVITTLPPYFESLGKRIVKSSKLYFVDVGLACYLLGIQDPVQLSNHPLRGYLFENLIINEVTKSLFSRGEEANLYFYRDSNQLEVDLILPRALSMIAIEIKAAKSFHSEFLRGLSKFKDLVKNHTVRNYLIYTGEHQQKVHDVTLLNYQNTEKVVSS